MKIRIGLLAMVMTCGLFAAEVRYVAADGDDAADGLTPATAWRTLGKMNRELPAGGEARLRRGDVFYGIVRLKPGPNSDQCTVLTVYGEGAAPEIRAYKIAKPTAWTATGTNHLWRIDLSNPSQFEGNTMTDSGNVGFLKVDGVIHGWKRFRPNMPAKQWEFIDDGRRVTVWSERHPAKMAKEILFAPNVRVIAFQNNIRVQGVIVRGTGGHGASGVGQNVQIEDCAFYEIGGSLLPGYGDGKTRYGNGVEAWAGSSDVQVTRCAFSDIYDVGFTLQGPNPERSWKNCHVTDCTFDRCTQAFELWTTKCAPGIGMENCSFQRNVCTDTGRGWAYGPRPNKDCSTPLLVYHMQTEVCDVLVTSNRFVNSRDALIFKSGGLSTLPRGYRVEGNTIVGNPTMPVCRNQKDDASTAARATEIRAKNNWLSF